MIRTYLSLIVLLMVVLQPAQAQVPAREGGYVAPHFVPAPSDAIDDWTPLAGAIEPRVEGHSALIEGKIYVFGGFQTQDIVPTDQNEVYDIATDSWSTFAPLPHPVTHVGSAEADGKVWLAGGFAVLNYTQIVDHVWIYDPVEDSWTEGPPLPAKRSAGALVRLGRKLHYFSGLENRNDNVGDHYVLDLDEPGGPQTWTSAAPLPDPRDHLSGVALGGKIYAIGGQFGHDIDPQDTNLMHVYDPAADAWTRLADLPYIRSHYEPGTLVVDGKIVIAGGRTGTQNCVDDVTQYDPQTDTWSHLFDMPACLIAPSAKVAGEAMYLSHGGKVSVLFPTTEAYRRSIDRASGDTLGFWPDRLTATLDGGAPRTFESVLWTHSGDAAYTIDTAGLPAWITALTPASGVADVPGAEIDLTVDAAGLPPGTYAHTLVASAAGYPDATLELSITVIGDVMQQHLEEGWNLVGLPVAPDDPNYAAIYAAVAPLFEPYAYAGSYQRVAEMAPGAGYWINTAAAGTVSLSGTPSLTLSYDLEAGWNLISGPACAFPLDAATGDTSIWTTGLAYGYTQSAGYTTTGVLVPGKGYWIETSAAGTVTMDCTTL